MDKEIENLPEGHVVAESVAIAEVTEFVNKFKFKPITEDALLKDFSEVIYAMQLGVLTFNDLIPTLTLQEPIMTVAGNVHKDKVVFKTRILASEQEKLSRGMDLKNQMLLYLQKSQAYLIGEPVAMLDKFSRLDNKIIEQLTTLFM